MASGSGGGSSGSSGAIGTGAGGGRDSNGGTGGWPKQAAPHKNSSTSAARAHMASSLTVMDTILHLQGCHTPRAKQAWGGDRHVSVASPRLRERRKRHAWFAGLSSGGRKSLPTPVSSRNTASPRN